MLRLVGEANELKTEQIFLLLHSCTTVKLLYTGVRPIEIGSLHMDNFQPHN